MSEANFSYPIPSADWKAKLCFWADSRYPYFALTDGNDHHYPKEAFESRFLAGNKALTEKEIFDKDCKIQKVGIIGYDFKNRLENLESENPAFLELPDILFFQPDFCLEFIGDKIYSSIELKESFWNEIDKILLPNDPAVRCKITPQLDRKEYMASVKAIQNQIVEGNTYEANFCQAYSGPFHTWDPISAYFLLNKKSPMPFSALFKAKSKWIVSASPERFIKKAGDRLIAQPIKGTIRRGSSPETDETNKNQLLASEKERAENLMITDLMRNDLARVSQTGTVRVEELFGIYALPRVFQMISTVTSTLRPEVDFSQIIQATFPMGSMTGAPKISTMNIIEQEERFKRGWFSGAFGYIKENGDFDFSVIIRSIIADSEQKQLYFGVGSAITFDADAAQEYAECELKAQAILEVLSGK